MLAEIRAKKYQVRQLETAAYPGHPGSANSLVSEIIVHQVIEICGDIHDAAVVVASNLKPSQVLLSAHNLRDPPGRVLHHLLRML